MLVTSRFFSWSLALMGGVTLLNVAARLWRHPAGFGPMSYTELCIDAVLVVVIWFAYHRHTRDLDNLTVHVEKKLHARLLSGPYSIAFFAYIFLLQGLMGHRY
jgi:hypothetical protein